MRNVNFYIEPADICVITYSSDEINDHWDLIKQCLDSIIENTDPKSYRLHIGCNHLSARAMEYIDYVVANHGATKYIGNPLKDAKGNIAYPKYPLMRRIYENTDSSWVIWFDDDVFVSQYDWLEVLQETIRLTPDADQFGLLRMIALPLSVKEEWIDRAKWSRPGKIRYSDMSECRMIISPFIMGGFYALSRNAIMSCQIPDERLFHNFGDWTTGMALSHNGFKLADFNYGVTLKEAPRRGIHMDLAILSNEEMVRKKRIQKGMNTFQWEKVSKSNDRS